MSGLWRPAFPKDQMENISSLKTGHKLIVYFSQSISKVQIIRSAAMKELSGFNCRKHTGKFVFLGTIQNIYDF